MSIPEFILQEKNKFTSVDSVRDVLDSLFLHIRSTYSDLLLQEI